MESSTSLDWRLKLEEQIKKQIAKPIMAATAKTKSPIRAASIAVLNKFVIKVS